MQDGDIVDVIDGGLKGTTVLIRELNYSGKAEPMSKVTLLTGQRAGTITSLYTRKLAPHKPKQQEPNAAFKREQVIKREQMICLLKKKKT